MKFPKLPKLFKKKYVVIYVIIFLLIASVLVFYFYGSFREGVLTTAEMEQNANYNVRDSKIVYGNIDLDLKAANISQIPDGKTITGNIVNKLQTEFNTIAAEVNKNITYSSVVDAGKKPENRHAWASDANNQSDSYRIQIPGCNSKLELVKIEQNKEAIKKDPKIPVYVSPICPIKPYTVNDKNVLKDFVH